MTEFELRETQGMQEQSDGTIQRIAMLPDNRADASIAALADNRPAQRMPRPSRIGTQHDAWHVVQCAQGRVKPTMQMKGGVPVNDDKGLEYEAEVMGRLALHGGRKIPLQRSSAILSGQASHADVVQRAKIWATPTSYLGSEEPTRANIERYVNEYEIVHMKKLAVDYCTDDAKRQEVVGAYAAYQQEMRTQSSSAGPNWGEIKVALEALVTKINEALESAPAAPTGYEAADTGNWDDKRAAVLAAQGVIKEGEGLPPQSKEEGARKIHTISYSAACSTFPATLRRLLRDIHAAWKAGAVMDLRGQGEAHSRTSNNPGALRSWHMNTSKTLPAAAIETATPENATKLEEHYRETSGTQNGLGVRGAGPIGYAEYTGTGILNDAHSSKIVLDYKRGDVYLTLSHYQHWSEEGENSARTGGQSPDGQHTYSPWFKIDMHS